jgi:hypothetical protein
MRVVPLLAVTIALVSGMLAWQQRHGLLALETQAASLSAEVATKKDAMREQDALLDRLREENEVYRKEFASLREKVSTRTATQNREDGASSASSESANANVFSKMAKDPRLKEVTRQWQIARLKKIYGDFVRARHLNAAQAKQFFDLLVKEDTRSREEAAKLLGGEENKTGPDEPSSTPQKAEIEQQLKLLLGDNVYAEYEEYKESTGDRLTLLQVQEHFARTSVPLRPDQANTLLQSMLEEHGLNQSVLDRMETVLTPEQFEELERFQDVNREMLSLRTEAALEMMKRKNKNDTPAPTPSP